MPSPPEVRIVETAADLFQAAALEFVALASQAIQARGRFSVALSGGSTPLGMFRVLAGGSIPGIAWDKIFFFWGDERHVPPDHPDSNYRMTKAALLSKVPVPEKNIFRIHAEDKDAAAAANDYEQNLRSFFRLQPGDLPRFDLILLGLGTEGHTASLFPGSSALQEQQRLVVATWVEKLKTDRITLTLPVINHAACVTFLVSGADKAAIVREVLQDPAEHLPAQKVRPLEGKLVWLLDRAAAAGLRKKTA
jgi:6-phosphogluconolactonase